MVFAPDCFEKDCEEAATYKVRNKDQYVCDEHKVKRYKKKQVQTLGNFTKTKAYKETGNC